VTRGPVRTSFRDRVSDGARLAVDAAGSGTVIVLAILLAVAWVVVGLVRGFTETWLSVLFAVSGAVTFVMVFLIQHATARDLRAVLLKLDELVTAHDDASDEVIRAERRPLNEQEELEERLIDR
jgi:low affinity Fe/Cu permease